MSIPTGFRRGLRALIPLLAIVGLVFASAAPANAEVILSKRIQVFVPDSGTAERIFMRRVFNGQTTQVIADGQIAPGQWQRIDSYVKVGETQTVTLYRFLLGKGWEPYKEFVTKEVPADDKQFFWLDTTLYK